MVHHPTQFPLSCGKVKNIMLAMILQPLNAIFHFLSVSFEYFAVFRQGYLLHSLQKAANAKCF